MPYIEGDKHRRDISNGLREPKNAGELNFLITTLLLNYLDSRISYTRLNEVIGVLESCKLEFYRRQVSPYEDEKIRENGDVYTS